MVQHVIHSAVTIVLSYQLIVLWLILVVSRSLHFVGIVFNWIAEYQILEFYIVFHVKFYIVSHVESSICHILHSSATSNDWKISNSLLLRPFNFTIGDFCSIIFKLNLIVQNVPRVRMRNICSFLSLLSQMALVSLNSAKLQNVT